jgi:hypothetical protein
MMNFKITNIYKMTKMLVLEGVVSSGFVKIGDILYNEQNDPLPVSGIVLGGNHDKDKISLSIKLTNEVKGYKVNIGDTLVS